MRVKVGGEDVFPVPDLQNFSAMGGLHSRPAESLIRVPKPLPTPTVALELRSELAERRLNPRRAVSITFQARNCPVRSRAGDT
jgi:hypothetical protein